MGTLHQRILETAAHSTRDCGRERNAGSGRFGEVTSDGQKLPVMAAGSSRDVTADYSR